MKQNLRFLMLALLCAVTNFAWGDRWVEVTDLTSLDANGNDVIVIVDKTSSRAMSNDNGTTSAPAGVQVTLSGDKSEITSSVNETLMWRFMRNQENIQFQKYATSANSNYLYTFNDNNSVRVGTSNNNKFVLESNYLKNVATSRYVGYYSNNNDWRCYTSTTGNIKDTKIAFYKKTAETNPYTITAVSNNTDYGTVSVSGNRITATPNTGYRVSTTNPYTVTPENSATVSQNGNTFTVNATADCTVQINFEAIPTYTVTYNCNGGDSGCPTVTTQTIADGDEITIADAPSKTDYSFTGWSDGTDIYNAGANYTVNNNVTFTAQWEEKGEVSVFEHFTGALEEGDYIIYYNGYAMKNTVSSNRLSYATVTPSNDVIEDPDASIIWHIAPSGNYWTIYNADVKKYAAGTGTKNQAQLLSSGTDNKALWIAEGTETYEFVNLNNSTLNTPVNANLRNNGTSGFACYSKSTGGALTLYKAISSTGKRPIAILPSSISPTNLVIDDTGTFTLDGATYVEGQTYTTTWESLTPAIISFDGATYTALSSGTATVKVTITPTSTSAENYHDVYHEYTVYVEKKTPEIEAIDNMNLETGETQTFTVSCNSDAEITATSNKESVATVSKSGNSWVVTAIGKGTATITITSPATETYKKAEITFSVKVTGSLAPGTLFYESFDSSEGYGGNDEKWYNFSQQFTLVCDNEGWTTTRVNGAYQCAKFGTTNDGASATTPTINTGGGKVTLSFRAGSWTSDNAKLYVAIFDGETEKETKEYSLPDSEFGDYTFDITDVDNLILKFYTTGGKNRLFLDEITVSKEVVTATFNPKYKGFTSIYYSDKNLKMPADVTAHTYKVVNGKGEYIDNITEGQVIPAGTPVMLEYGKSFTEAVTVTFEEADASDAVTLTAGNMLRGSDDVDSDGYTTAPNNGNADDYYFYVLSVGKKTENANKIGFYWKEADGSKFKPTPHKIYLALLKSEVDAASASMISIYEGDGIDSVVASDNTPQDVYTLSGVRMNSNNLPKGIYIIGGKKVAVK